MTNSQFRESLLGAFFCFKCSSTHSRPAFTFTTNLCNALRKKGFVIDDDDGDQKFLFFVKTNENSKTIPVVVFSQNSAFSSSSDLDQLVDFLENNRSICPIFYKIDPSDVRRLIGRYGEVMARHENPLGPDSEEMQKRRSALIQVTHLPGWKFQTNGYKEKEIIEDIVEWFTENSSSFRHDVLISYYQEDTGSSFTSFLDNSLRQQRFKTFLAHEGVEADQRMEAIKESRLFIVVFSQNYVCSSSLDGLVEIIKLSKSKNQRICPIFFSVSPLDVRHQATGYDKAMSSHKNSYGQESDKVNDWSSTFSAVANSSGWHLETGYEYKTIQDIVESVNKSLARYDTFLSFTGQDTRDNFTGHLYNALCKKGFKTFMDEEGLDGGDEISETFVKAIKEAKSSIIVFSEKYAFSPWCLNELASIVNCMKTRNHLVWPIFYKVEPSDVWKQKNSYKTAMGGHMKRLGKRSEKVLKWGSSLSQVADLVKRQYSQTAAEKWHFKSGSEDMFIRNIVEMVAAT